MRLQMSARHDNRRPHSKYRHWKPGTRTARSILLEKLLAVGLSIGAVPPPRHLENEVKVLVPSAGCETKAIAALGKLWPVDNIAALEHFLAWAIT